MADGDVRHAQMTKAACSKIACLEIRLVAHLSPAVAGGPRLQPRGMMIDGARGRRDYFVL